MNLPVGFRYAGVGCGIKNEGRDLALIVSDANCVTAGVYTQNVVRAACIDFNRSITPSDTCRALVVNSGNANACTGIQGETDCQKTADLVAQQIGCQANQVLVLSTGVIGQVLPMNNVAAGIRDASEHLAATPAAFDSAAAAFMTTDKFQKTKTIKLQTEHGDIHIAGIAKGAGMIGPNMATMLCALVTDANLTADAAQSVLTDAVDFSFNRISVDGHTSTNDAVILMSSAQVGLAGYEAQFQSAVNELCLDLAKMIPTDGEGASHLIEVSVIGAETADAANQIAKTVAMSNLVKTAISGCDPNWGRIVSAAGYCGVDLKPAEMNLKLNGFSVFENGNPIDFDEKEVSDSLANSVEASIELVVGRGPHQAKHWTSDLTTDYVVLNSEYRT